MIVIVAFASPVITISPTNAYSSPLPSRSIVVVKFTAPSKAELLMCPDTLSVYAPDTGSID